jgi:hypothetical protein
MSQNPRQAQIKRQLDERFPDKQTAVKQRDDGTIVAGVRDPDSGEVQTREIDPEQAQSQRSAVQGQGEGARDPERESVSAGGREERIERGPTGGGEADEPDQPDTDGTTGDDEPVRAPSGPPQDDGQDRGAGADGRDEPVQAPTGEGEQASAPNEQSGGSGGGGPAALARNIVGGAVSGGAQVGSAAADRGGSILGSASQTIQSEVVKPAAEFGREGGQAAASGLRSSLAVGAFGSPTASPEESEEQTGSVGEGLIGGTASLANVPQFALDVAEAGEVAGAAAGAAGRDVGDAAGSGGLDTEETQQVIDQRIAPPVQQAAEAAQENPAVFAGSLAGGAVAGGAAGRALLQAGRSGRFASATQRARARASEIAKRTEVKSRPGALLGGFKIETRPKTGDIDVTPDEPDAPLRFPTEQRKDRIEVDPDRNIADRETFRRSVTRKSRQRRLTPGEDLREATDLAPETLPQRTPVDVGGVLEGGGVGGVLSGTDAVTESDPGTDTGTDTGVGSLPAVGTRPETDTTTDTDPDDEDLVTPRPPPPDTDPTTTRPPTPLLPTPTTPTRPRPRGELPDREPDGREFGLSVAGDGRQTSSEETIAPGFLSETIRDIALFGGAPASDADVDLDEAATTGQLLTGEVPTATEIAGSEQAQAQIEETEDLLGFNL